jgi:hypothetical protein
MDELRRARLDREQIEGRKALALLVAQQQGRERGDDFGDGYIK